MIMPYKTFLDDELPDTNRNTQTDTFLERRAVDRRQLNFAHSPERRSGMERRCTPLEFAGQVL